MKVIKKIIHIGFVTAVAYAIKLESGPATMVGFVYAVIMIELIGLYAGENNERWTDLIGRLSPRSKT